MSPDVLFASAYGPLLIFLVRIVDVSLSTVRSLMVMRGQKAIAPAVAFFESLLWVFAVGTAIQNLGSPWHVLGYAAGFATGNLVGLWIEEKLALGLATVRIVSRFGGVELAEALREVGHGVSAGVSSSGDSGSSRVRRDRAVHPPSFVSRARSFWR